MTPEERAHEIVFKTPFLSVKSQPFLPHNYILLEQNIAAAIRDAVEAEREGCAQAVIVGANDLRDWSTAYYDGYKEATRNAIARIRARGQP